MRLEEPSELNGLFHKECIVEITVEGVELARLVMEWGRGLPKWNFSDHPSGRPRHLSGEEPLYWPSTEQPGEVGAVPDPGQVDDHGDVPVTAAGVAPHVLVHADHRRTASRPRSGVASLIGQHRVVCRVPGDAKTAKRPPRSRWQHRCGSTTR